jgi:hypothetical protein
MLLPTLPISAVFLWRCVVDAGAGVLRVPLRLRSIGRLL